MIKGCTQAPQVSISTKFLRASFEKCSLINGRMLKKKTVNNLYNGKRLSLHNMIKLFPDNDEITSTLYHKGKTTSTPQWHSLLLHNVGETTPPTHTQRWWDYLYDGETLSTCSNETFWWCWLTLTIYLDSLTAEPMGIFKHG